MKLTSTDEQVYRTRYAVVALVSLVVVAPQAVAAQDPDSAAVIITRRVERIGLSEGIGGRRQAILDALKSIGLTGHTIPFDPPASVQVARRGVNITAEIPSPALCVLLLGAHYDRVERGQGVIDNAAGVAVVLQLAEAFIREPLRHFKVALAFFDLEEDGRLGSKAMVADSIRSSLPSVFLNFDIFGYGDAMWVGTNDLDSALPRLVSNQGRLSGLEVVIDSMYPSSDHVSFRATRTASYAISLLDAPDVHTLLQRFRTRGAVRGATPRIFTIMHTAEDTLDKLDAVAVVRGAKAVEQALRLFDRQQSRIAENQCRIQGTV